MEIYNLILKEGTVEVAYLADLFQVTPQTIRRDFKDLSDQNLIEVGYGGAGLALNNNIELQFQYKEKQQIRHKELICQKAVRLIKDGTVIAIDSGTTTMGMIKYLAERPLTIITDNIPLVGTIKNDCKAKIVVAGGIYDAVSAGTMGTLTTEFFNSYNVDIAFVATMGIDDEGWLSVVNPEDAGTKKALFNCAKKKILLADESKFSLSFLCRYQNISDFDLVISDSEERPAFLGNFQVDYL